MCPRKRKKKHFAWVSFAEAMERNDAKTQRWLPNAFALRSSDWRLCTLRRPKSIKKNLVLPHWFSLARRDGVPRRSGAGAWRARLTAEAGEGWRTTLSYCTSCLGRGTGTLRPRGGALWCLPSPAARSGRGRTRTGRARAASGMRCAWREAPRAGAMRTCCDQWIVAHAQWLLWPLNIQILAVMS